MVFTCDAVPWGLRIMKMIPRLDKDVKQTLEQVFKDKLDALIMPLLKSEGI